jgi:hypothetical protein
VAERDLRTLEAQLDSFDPAERSKALSALQEEMRRGRVALADPGPDVNLHCHTFFSYNTYGYSPTKIAWLGRKSGWGAAGIADFDVLDGAEEFLSASAALNLRASAGMETRVYVPEFADLVINSPGEPGISYHMGVGFPASQLGGASGDFIERLRGLSEDRNRGLVERVNRYLSPVSLDYGHDVLPLTPSGNATERHICLAYARKARCTFSHSSALGRFWADKLGTEPDALDLPEGPGLQSLIRLKTMKRGGVGYVQPDTGSFPRLEETNRWILGAGGIPVQTWLDGTSDGEQRMRELLEVGMSTGVAAINVIPDRTYGTGAGDEKPANLRRVLDLAQELSLLVVVGTEMNSPGQRLVDDFESPELRDFVPLFLDSAHAIYAHSVLQRKAELGYGSDWARQHFPDMTSQKGFFQTVGGRLEPRLEHLLDGLPQDPSPADVVARVEEDSP